MFKLISFFLLILVVIGKNQQDYTRLTCYHEQEYQKLKTMAIHIELSSRAVTYSLAKN